MKFQNLLEYINDHAARTETIHGWSVTKTKHGHEREQERHGGELPGGHHEFIHKVIKKISGVKNPRSGEFMYHSAKHNQAAVLNVDHEKKQLRVITVLPKGKSMPKPGTQKFMVEGVETEIECVILHDTEFDEAMDQFMTEEFGVTLDEATKAERKVVELSHVDFNKNRSGFQVTARDVYGVAKSGATIDHSHYAAGRNPEENDRFKFEVLKAFNWSNGDRDKVLAAAKKWSRAPQLFEETIYERSSKEHHTKFAKAHETAAKNASDEESKSLHTRGMNLHKKAALTSNAQMSKMANDHSKAVKAGTAGVPGMDNVPKHIKDDEMNRRYSSPGPKFRQGTVKEDSSLEESHPVGTKVKFKSFAKQKQATNSINPDAVFTVTSCDGEWMKLDNRHEVHHSEIKPHKK